MWLLPGLDLDDLQTVHLSKGEAISYASFVYFTALCLILVLVFTTFNAYKFIYQQKRFTVFTLVSFYIFTVIILMMRLSDLLFFISFFENQNLTCLMFPANVKIAIGLVQIMAIIEVTIRVNSQSETEKEEMG